MVDEQGPGPQQAVPRPDERQVGLRLRATVVDRAEKLGIEPSEAGQHFRIHPVLLAGVGVDQPQFAGVGHQNLMPELPQQLARPKGVRPHLHRHPAAGKVGKRAPEGRLGRRQAALLDHLALPVHDVDQRMSIPQFQTHEKPAILEHGRLPPFYAP